MNFVKFFDGLKTYLVAATAILTAITAYTQGQLDLLAMLAAIGAALSAAGLRHGLAKFRADVVPATDVIAAIDQAIAFLSWLAAKTSTTVDDELVSGLKQVRDFLAANPELITLLERMLLSGQATEANVRAAVYGKLGDGKLLEVLIKVLPIILQFIK